jgi:uncharacterized phiE125 gp8 family phage protein
MITLGTVAKTTTLALTAEEMRDHLRIADDTEDASLYAYLRAATDWTEGYLNRALMNRTHAYYLGAWPRTGDIELPRPPLVSVSGINYTVSGATATYGSTFAATKYWVDTAAAPGRVTLKYGQSWPSDTLETGHPIKITYVAGYGTVGHAIPDGIRSALLLQVADLYEYREETSAGALKPREAVIRLLAPHRVVTMK